MSAEYPTKVTTQLFYVAARLKTTLTDDITQGASTISVASTAGFPDKGFITIDNETKQYTGKTALTFTGCSNINGNDVAHSNGAEVRCAISSETINRIIDEIIATQTALGITGAFNFLDKTGWISASETWTYASATTITVPSDARLKYGKGDKIRLKQGGDWKYYYIIDVAETVLTVTGGSDYTVANAAITDNYYSKVENPLGFPASFTFTATGSADGSMTWTSITWTLAKFRIEGRKCILWIEASGTTGGTASNILVVTPTSGHIPTATAQTRIGALIFDGLTISGVSWIAINKTIGYRRYDGANFGLGAGRGIGGQIAYYF